MAVEEIILNVMQIQFMICRGRGTKNVWNHVFIQVSIEMKAVELWTLTKHGQTTQAHPYQ